MQSTYQYQHYGWRVSEEQRTGRPRRHPVVIIGAGPVGLTAALECASLGLPVVVLDDNDTVSIGSRAVCYAKRPLEIWDRLGVGESFADRGIRWHVGKVFLEEGLVYQFNLLPESDHKMPAMVNLQQYYLEETLVSSCQQQPLVDLRWKHRLISLKQHDDLVELAVETPDGIFTMQADWLVACDGANSDTRRMVGAEFSGQFFQDRFLIADVLMRAQFPTERWFWFDPPFHRGQSVLLHKQTDDLWRIDFQLGWDADPEQEKKPENVIPRIRAMLGPQADFELEWVSVYQFACRRIDRFRYGRVLFAGDAAHQVSPFGARGANSGVQDIDNLIWKLKHVLQGVAPVALLDSYDEERALAADENLLNSTRSTDFITPKSRLSRTLRNAVLSLARTEPFARPLVNSGRLSTPTAYLDSSLNTPDESEFESLMRPGTPCADAPMIHGGQGQGATWLLNHLGAEFVVLTFGADMPIKPINVGAVKVRFLRVGADLLDPAEVAAFRYDGLPGTVYLIRPDQHVAARWRTFDARKIEAAVLRCLGWTQESA